ncbi:hypothetical protein ACU639_29285 [Streptomyces cynarae]|uniref:hypothetical protein n=1 Tax=Streptomyces cynarae TaxID=2981134 RepID=UPI00406C386F
MAGIDLDSVGYVIGGLFLVAWICSFLYWKAAGRPGEHRALTGRGVFVPAVRVAPASAGPDA